MMVCQSGWTGRLTPGRTRRVCGITGWVDFERDLTGCLPRLNDMFTFAVWPAELDAEGMAAAAFLLDVNEWLTEYRVSLV